MLTAAVRSGADAVYLGLTGFNARQGAGNFTPDALGEAVAFCHARGVRVHVTLNTLVYAEELPALADSIRAVAEAGADAVIVDDLATAALIRKIAPGLALHGSTQMSIHTPAGAKQLAAMGFARVILARELSLQEIAAITADCPIETEVFVHGAQCMAMSGQCMMSVFLGGRSGNRGACAGPCRLPFDASNLRRGVPGQACHLSLKDMDVIPHLPALAAAGVAIVKIEGRLRTPEYAAAAVYACRCALAGQPYDTTLLADIFSRSGFSDGYLAGNIDRALFGVRTAEDSAKTKAATPKARELFRREYGRVPVHFTLSLSADGAKLTARDEAGNRAIAYGTEELPPAHTDPAEALTRSLEKTGGTPFTAAEIRIESDGGPWFLPGSAANELRRQCLETLLQKRSAPRPLPVQAAPVPTYPPRATRPGGPALAARFARVGQLADLTAEELNALACLILPLEEADALPPALRPKTVLELPRAMFGGLERATALRLAGCQKAGYLGFAANNLAHLHLAPPNTLPLYGGLGLNVTNPLAAAEYAALGLKGLLLHPETSVAAMRPIGPGIPTAALCYGHIPLMLTRACPLQNVRSCADCPKAGTLRDRKARDFVVRCGGGVRTIYNPVPLYMGDRLNELPTDGAIAYFTTELPARAAQVLRLLRTAAPFDGEFTRGLYYK
ncbi:MAG: U32 family peptidase [Gemmiger sp.]|nr:U32 family peptidase [Gemmiger sp.]